MKPLQQPHIPVFFGGSSDVAIEIAGRHADVYAFWGETLDQARETIARVRASVARAGRDPAAIRFSLSFRPVLAATEEAAWARADRIIARIRELRADAAAAAGRSPRASAPSACWKRRPAAACATSGCGPRWRRRSAPARTPRRWSARRSRWRTALADYHALGVSTFLIRGFDPLEDASAYGRDLLPATRAAVAAASRNIAAVAA